MARESRRMIPNSHCGTHISVEAHKPCRPTCLRPPLAVASGSPTPPGRSRQRCRATTNAGTPPTVRHPWIWRRRRRAPPRTKATRSGRAPPRSRALARATQNLCIMKFPTSSAMVQNAATDRFTCSDEKKFNGWPVPAVPRQRIPADPPPDQRDARCPQGHRNRHEEPPETDDEHPRQSPRANRPLDCEAQARKIRWVRPSAARPPRDGKDTP